MQEERSTLETDADIEPILVEARARIIWGESVSEVSTWMIGQGVAREEIDSVVRQCQRERAIHIRKVGLRDVAIGVPLLLLAAIILVAIWPSWGFTEYAGLAGVLGVFGGVWVCKGVWRLLCGASEAGSLTDM